MRGELDLLRRMLEINRVGTWEIYFPYLQVRLNGAGAQMLGGLPADWVKAPPKAWLSRVHPADRAYLRSQMSDFASADMSYFFVEIRVLHQNGYYLWTRLSGEVAERDEQGASRRAVGTFILLNRHHSHARENDEKLYTQLFQDDPLLRYIFDRKTWSILDVNQKVVTLYGYSREEWMEMTLADFRPAEDVARLKKSLENLPKKGQVQNQGVVRHLNKAGELLYLEEYIRPIIFQNREAIQTSLVDVTDSYLNHELNLLEKELSQKLMKSPDADKEALDGYLHALEGLLPGSYCSLVKVEAQKIKTWAAPSLPAAYNEAVNNTPTGEFNGSCGRAAWLGKRVITSNIEEAPEWQAYLEIIRPHGLRACWSQPVLNHQGKVCASLAFYRKQPDEPGPLELKVMEREAEFLQNMLHFLETENHLREKNERSEYVNRATRDVIYDYDLVQNIVEISPRFTEVFGHTVPEGKESLKDWEKFLHPGDLERVKQSFEGFLYQSVRSHWQAEYRLLRADGSYAEVQDRVYLLRDEAGKPLRVIGALADMSKEKQERAHLKLLESVITHTKDAILITAAEALQEPGPKILYANAAFEEMTGYSRKEVLGRSPRFLQGPLTDRKELDKLNQSLAAGRPEEICVVNYRKDGTPFWIEMTISPIKGESGEISHFIAVERDVTARQEAYLRKERQAEVAVIFDNAADLKAATEGVLDHHLQLPGLAGGQFWMLTQNKNALKLVGGRYKNQPPGAQPLPDLKLKKGEGLAGRAWETRTSISGSASGLDSGALPGFPPEACQRLSYAAAVPILRESEFQGVLLLAGSGAPQDFSYELKRLEGNGNFLGRKIQHKRLEENILKIYNTAPNLICQADMEGYILSVNSQSREIFGLRPEELQGQSCLQLLAEKEQAVFKTAFWQPVLEGRRIRGFQAEARNANGEVIYLEWHGQAVPEEGLVYLIIQDVTEKRIIERLLDKATNLARIGGWDYDLQNQQLEWTSMTRQIYEVDEDYRPQPKDLIEYVRKDFAEWVKQRLDITIEQGQVLDLEIPLQTAQGQERWVRLQGDPLMADGHCYRISGSIQDIHVRKVAQLQLRQSNYRFEKVTEATSDAIWDWDMVSDEFYLGYGFQKLFGYPSNKVPFTREGWRQNVHPEDMGILDKKLNDLVRDDRAEFWEAEYRYRRYDGSYARVIDRGKLLRDTHGNPVRMVGAISDLTEYYQHLWAIEDQNQRLRDIAQTQSHQVRGPLASIMGLVQLVEQDMVETGQEKEILHKIAQVAHQLDQVVHRIVERTAQEEKHLDS